MVQYCSAEAHLLSSPSKGGPSTVRVFSRVRYVGMGVRRHTYCPHPRKGGRPDGDRRKRVRPIGYFDREHTYCPHPKRGYPERSTNDSVLKFGLSGVKFGPESRTMSLNSIQYSNDADIYSFFDKIILQSLEDNLVVC